MSGLYASSCKIKVDIVCKVHGEFTQKPNDHLSGHGCPKCCFENNGILKKNKHALNYINIANNVHNNIYNYSMLNYVDSENKITIICPIHGKFTQYPQEHLRGSGCQKCNMSKGELNIIKILEKNSINYITQKKFDNCVNKRKLPFDFYLPDYNICIEFDGIQHYKPVKFTNYSKEKSIRMLEYIKTNDMIKNNFCSSHNITLIRISYLDENIEMKILKYFKS